MAPHRRFPYTAGRLQRLESMMGKGDSRSRRGKIYQGSFGKTRPKDPTKGKKPVVAAKAKSTTAKKQS